MRSKDSINKRRLKRAVQFLEKTTALHTVFGYGDGDILYDIEVFNKPYTIFMLWVCGKDWISKGIEPKRLVNPTVTDIKKAIANIRKGALSAA